jgi:hypothetical protein
MLRLLAFLVLIAPLAARAAPVEISLTGLGLSCSGGGLTCPSGVAALSLGGSLQADLGADMALTNVYGMISFQVIGSGASGGLGVTGGTIDLDADGDALGITTRLALSDGRTLWFADRITLGPANSFDGTNLYLVGSTWRPGTLPGSAPWLSVGLLGTVKPVLSGAARPIPEPTSFALLAVGGLLVGTALRRRE